MNARPSNVVDLLHYQLLVPAAGPVYCTCICAHNRKDIPFPSTRCALAAYTFAPRVSIVAIVLHCLAANLARRRCLCVASCGILLRAPLLSTPPLLGPRNLSLAAAAPTATFPLNYPHQHSRPPAGGRTGRMERAEEPLVSLAEIEAARLVVRSRVLRITITPLQACCALL